MHETFAPRLYFLFSAIAIAVLQLSCLSRSVCITTLHVPLYFLTLVSCLASFSVSWDLFLSVYRISFSLDIDLHHLDFRFLAS